MVVIRLLGVTSLSDEKGGFIPLPTKKCGLLMGYLACNKNILLDRSSVASMLWPDQNESRARRNLNNEIWRLRKYLDNALVTDSQTLKFAPDGKIEIDVEIFERINAGSSVLEFEEAISLYRGQFMSGFFEDWVLVKREYFADRLVHYLDHCAVHYQENNDVRKAVACVRKILLLDPVNEASHRRLMRLYVMIDDYYSALWQYRECEEILERELNVPPMPETQALYEQIQKQLAARKGGK